MEIEYIELYPNIHVYTNLMPDAQELYEIMKESEQKSYGKYFLRNWDQWSYFGTYSQKKDIGEPVEFGEMYSKENFLIFGFTSYIYEYLQRVKYASTTFSNWWRHLEHYPLGSYVFCFYVC